MQNNLCRCSRGPKFPRVYVLRVSLVFQIHVHSFHLWTDYDWPEGVDEFFLTAALAITGLL